MLTVAQFCVSATEENVDAKADGLHVSIRKVHHPECRVLKATLSVSSCSRSVFIEKIDVDDGVYFSEYPIRVSLGRPKEIKPQLQLVSPAKCVTSACMYREIVCYFRIANPGENALIKGGIHYQVPQTTY